MQVEHFLESSARRFPHKTALVCGSRRLTYRELDRRANRLAHRLLAEGVKRGERVVIYLENSVEAIISLFAILKAGAVFVVANPNTRADKLEFTLNNCRASGLITDQGRGEALETRRAFLPHLRKVWNTGASQRVASTALCFEEATERPGFDDAPGNRCIDADLAALIYTSGSTGRPKGVMLTHLNMISAATSVTTYLKNTEHDVIVSVLPLSSSYGVYQALTAFLIGGTIVLERGFSYPHEMLMTLIREKVTGFPIVPTIAAILLQLDLTKYPFPDLRYITNAAAALPTHHIQRLRKCFPNVALYSMYGLTECKRVSYLAPEQIEKRPNSVGRGMPNQELYIVDESGRRVGPGVIGELVVRGSHVMQGYWEMPEETRKVLRPGERAGDSVLYTGDLFKMDEEGYLYMVGRKDDMIKTRGEKVSPREIEEVLHGMDQVSEAAVVGVPDAVLGQAIKAVITLRPGCELSVQQVKQYCARRLEDFMVPKQVEFTESMPKTGSGKIAKRELAGAVNET